MAPGMSGDKRGNAVAFMRASQVFSTMDEASVLEAWAALEELGPEHAAKNNPNGGWLERLMMFATCRIAEYSPETAASILKNRRDLVDGEAMLVVFGSMAARDLARTEALALTLTGETQAYALGAIVWGIENDDPSAALNFAEKHKLDVRELLETWVLRDPKSAMDAAARLVQKSGEPKLIRETFNAWHKKDKEAAIAWAADYNGPGNVSVRAYVLATRAEEDPEKAVQEFAVLQHAATDARELGDLASVLGRNSARKNLPLARAWAEALPVGVLQDRAINGVASTWVQTDAPAASEWIKSLPAGTARDGAASVLAQTICKSDPAAAFEWAQSIQDAGKRHDSLRAVVAVWNEQNPDAAKAAVKDLPAEARSALGIK